MRNAFAPLKIIAQLYDFFVAQAEEAKAEAKPAPGHQGGQRAADQVVGVVGSDELEPSVALPGVTGKKVEVQQMLEGVYNWLAEGFDVPGLIKARTLQFFQSIIKKAT